MEQVVPFGPWPVPRTQDAVVEPEEEDFDSHHPQEEFAAQAEQTRAAPQSPAHESW